MARDEIGLLACLRKTVPGTDQLTVVATKYAVANGFAQLFGDDALMLDSQIRDASAGVKLLWPNNRARWTDVDAGLTSTALIFLNLSIYGQWNVGEYLAKKKPRTSRFV